MYCCYIHSVLLLDLEITTHQPGYHAFFIGGGGLTSCLTGRSFSEHVIFFFRSFELLVTYCRW